MDNYQESFADVNEVIRKILLQNNHGKILDLGCGQGKIVRAGLQNGLDIYGMDPSNHIVEFDNTFVKNRYVVGDATKIQYEDEYFEMVVSCYVLEHIAEEDIDTAIAEIRRVTKRYAFLIISTVIDEEKKYHLCVHDRTWWENKFFAHGFCKAASFFDVNEFHSIPGEATTEKTQLVLEKIPDEAFRLYPLAKLEKEAGLHNDMSRVTGNRSDAHLMRYYWASQFIRENDRVIDAACGLGYGVSLMANHCYSTLRAWLTRLQKRFGRQEF